MHRVGIAVTADVPVFEVATGCEVFGPRADWVSPWYQLELFAPRDVRFGGFFRLGEAKGLHRLAEVDTVIVPAAHDVTDPPEDLVRAVRAAHANGARIASICTGAFVLAAAGLLEGRRATTHWMHAARLAARHPGIAVEPDVLYVDEGDVLTSAGTAAGIDLCLHLVRQDHGAAVANDLARRLVTAPHRPGGQAQFIPRPVASGRAGDALARVMAWADAHLDRPITVEDLAGRAHLSSRQLTRQFAATTGTTPLQWLLTQRVNRARELLETTDASVERIAVDCGLGTATTLRRHLRRATGLPPGGYRRTFGVAGGAP